MTATRKKPSSPQDIVLLRLAHLRSLGVHSFTCPDFSVTFRPRKPREPKTARLEPIADRQLTDEEIKAANDELMYWSVRHG